MDYNSKTILKFKGRMVQVTYISVDRHRKGCVDYIVGEITASTKYHIILNSGRSGNEITLKYSQIKNISNPEKVEIKNN